MHVCINILEYSSEGFEKYVCMTLEGVCASTERESGYISKTLCTPNTLNSCVQYWLKTQAIIIYELSKNFVWED